MQKSPVSISVFFPAYNEELNIEQTVREADKVLSNLVDTYEIIVVNDGSKDRTGEIADNLARENNRVKVIHHNPNQGYGAAVWSGMTAAQYDYVFFTDADLQFDLSEIKNLLEYVPEYEAVIGYRAKRRDPFMRLLNAKGWNVLNRILFGLRVKDIDCAFKLFKRELVQGLSVQSRGAMLSAEMLIRLQRQGVTFKQVPVTHLPRVAGSPTGAKPAVILRAFKEMGKVYQGDLGDKRLIAVAKFILLGGLNTLVDWLLYIVLTRNLGYFADHLVVAKACAFFVGSIPVFVAHQYWVFGGSAALNRRDSVTLYGILAAAFTINTLSLAVLLAGGLNDIAALVLSTIISFAWNLSVAWLLLIKDRMFMSKAALEGTIL